jgi:hypothetical protein
MGKWTSYYDEARRDGLNGVVNAQQAALDGATSRKQKNRAHATYATATLFHHTVDGTGQRKISPTTTPIERSGIAANASTEYGRSADAANRLDAEPPVASNVMAEVRGLVRDRVPVETLDVEVYTNRSNCNECAKLVQKLADDVQAMLPAAKVTVTALSTRPDGQDMASVGGRKRASGEAQSRYGSTSATRHHTSDGTKYWRDQFVPGETSHRNAPVSEGPLRGGGILDSDTGRSPYVSSNSNSVNANHTDSSAGRSIPGYSYPTMNAMENSFSSMAIDPTSTGRYQRSLDYTSGVTGLASDLAGKLGSPSPSPTPEQKDPVQQAYEAYYPDLYKSHFKHYTDQRYSAQDAQRYAVDSAGKAAWDAAQKWVYQGQSQSGASGSGYSQFNTAAAGQVTSTAASGSKGKAREEQPPAVQHKQQRRGPAPS